MCFYISQLAGLLNFEFMDRVLGKRWGDWHHQTDGKGLMGIFESDLSTDALEIYFLVTFLGS